MAELVKMSDFIADFLASQGIRHAFAITGGASIHMIDSIARHPDIDYICPQHEQGGAMAADGYARVTGNLGCAIATSGPGATNLITGICCSYFDSVPVLYLTGQVTTFRFKGDTGVRQMGFQETDVVPMVEPVTKYAVLVRDPLRIRYELEKAVHIARSGRPGPVLVDVPDDLQRAQIDPSRCPPFVPQRDRLDDLPLSAEVARCLPLLAQAERPVLVIGWGVRLAHAADAVRELAERLRFPVLPSWAAMDIFPGDHPLLVGGFGTHGTRYGNFAVQNADLVLSIGARLSTRETGSPISSWARAARTIAVDIDPAELNKFTTFGRPLDLPIVADAARFTHELLARLEGFRGRPLDAWHERVRGWKRRYPVCTQANHDREPVDPYAFVDTLARLSSEGDVIFSDTGCAVAWMMQGFHFKRDQRFFHAFNNTPMGYGLPGAIGASLALGGRPVILVTGDGSLLMNIQELCTADRHALPIKVLLLNNGGYSMVQQTQDQWLEGRYFATTVAGGLSFPDFQMVARGCGFASRSIERNRDLEPVIKEVLAMEGPVLCDIRVPPESRVIPQVRFGRPIEDSEPFLDRGEFFENMIVEPLDVSRE
jgi:acetolactate synthase-1/2/3 large subunit